MKDTKTITVIIDIELSAEVPDILDKIAGRIYTMDKVEAVTAAYMESQE